MSLIKLLNIPWKEGLMGLILNKWSSAQTHPHHQQLLIWVYKNWKVPAVLCRRNMRSSISAHMFHPQPTVPFLHIKSWWKRAINSLLNRVFLAHLIWHMIKLSHQGLLSMMWAEKHLLRKGANLLWMNTDLVIKLTVLLVPRRTKLGDLIKLKHMLQNILWKAELQLGINYLNEW